MGKLKLLGNLGLGETMRHVTEVTWGNQTHVWYGIERTSWDDF